MSLWGPPFGGSSCRGGAAPLARIDSTAPRTTTRPSLDGATWVQAMSSSAITLSQSASNRNRFVASAPDIKHLALYSLFEIRVYGTEGLVLYRASWPRREAGS